MHDDGLTGTDMRNSFKHHEFTSTCRRLVFRRRCLSSLITGMKANFPCHSVFYFTPIIRSRIAKHEKKLKYLAVIEWSFVWCEELCISRVRWITASDIIRKSNSISVTLFITFLSPQPTHRLGSKLWPISRHAFRIWRDVFLADPTQKHSSSNMFCVFLYFFSPSEIELFH